MTADLIIAEIFYETGEIKFRYARVMSPDGSHWIRDGLFCEYHKNGHLTSEGNYSMGKERGIWRDFYPNGKIASEGNYEDGVEVGHWRHWDPEGNEIHEN